MEIWDLYTKDRIKTEETMVRGEKITKGFYRLVVHVCIFNSRGEMLIQQRQPFKSSWSNMWDITVGGSAISGDTSQSAAEREVYEEIGYKLSLDGIRPALTINFEDGFDDMYLIKKDIEISDLYLQYEEVKAVKWASKEEILNIWKEFSGRAQELNLPHAPKQFLNYFEEDNMPQTKLQRDLEGGMAISIGRLREDTQYDYKFVCLSHNTLRGAAGGGVLLAELLCAEGYMD